MFFKILSVVIFISSGFCFIVEEKDVSSDLKVVYSCHLKEGDTTKVVIVIKDTVFDDYKKIIKDLSAKEKACLIANIDEDEIGLVLDNNLFRFGDAGVIPDETKKGLLDFLIGLIPKQAIVLSNLDESLFTDNKKDKIKFLK
ncbi:MAG: hypothetical protein WCX88_02230 [Patescibacteria group bacterium]